MKKRLVSIGVALATFVAASALSVVLFKGMTERNRLESRNDCEKILSLLFASLRDYDNFGSAIEADPNLNGKIIGVGIYRKEGDTLYAWGDSPQSMAPPTFVDADVMNNLARIYEENGRNDSLILLIRPSRGEPRPPPLPGEDRDRAKARHEHPFLFETLRDAAVIRLEIRQIDFWYRQRLQTILFPVVEMMLAALIFFGRMLVIKNGEYRDRIEQQKNLVILGTAASTLAHEIKNPLLAIRLQTSILSKTLSGEGRREMEIINSEVDRLSSLSNRVNDYLRDPAGTTAVIDPSEVARDVGMRLCGRALLKPLDEASAVRVDPERLRSILENLVRNALEAGGDEEAVEMEITRLDGWVNIDVLDRGRGIPRQARDKLFDPFFTTKSKGSGIGLAICRRFALAAKGSVLLEDRPGGGIRARIALPAAKASGA